MTAKQITVEDYHRLIQAGVLMSGDPVELLEGEIVEKLKRSPAHEYVRDIMGERIRHVLPTEWHLRDHSAVTTGDSEPEPDLAIVVKKPRHYCDHHPGPTEIGLLVEIADSTLANDRKTKGRVYARAAIAVYWIVNLVDRQVEVYTDPDPLAAEPVYTSRIDFLPGDSVPLVLDGREVARLPVADLLP